MQLCAFLLWTTKLYNCNNLTDQFVFNNLIHCPHACSAAFSCASAIRMHEHGGGGHHQKKYMGLTMFCVLFLLINQWMESVFVAYTYEIVMKYCQPRPPGTNIKSWLNDNRACNCILHINDVEDRRNNVKQRKNSLARQYSQHFATLRATIATRWVHVLFF